MTTLKQILCAIINLGHRYPIEFVHEYSEEKIDEVVTVRFIIRDTGIVRKPCKCGKLHKDDR